MPAALRFVLIGLLLGTASFAVRAQELAPGSEPAAPLPPGVDRFYQELAKSEDRVLKSMAERYINLVKLQEWSDLSGKFRTVAHYVKHDPSITKVTIAIARGKGAERTFEQREISVDKLSKTCQSRVKQIDAMQKKIKEAAAKLAASGANGLPGGLGAPMTDERGAEPGIPLPQGGPQPLNAPPTAPSAEPVAPVPAPSTEPDPSATEPDPLGFAEVQLPPVPPPATEQP